MDLDTPMHDIRWFLDRTPDGQLFPCPAATAALDQLPHVKSYATKREALVALGREFRKSEHQRSRRMPERRVLRLYELVETEEQKEHPDPKRLSALLTARAQAIRYVTAEERYWFLENTLKSPPTPRQTMQLLNRMTLVLFNWHRQTRKSDDRRELRAILEALHDIDQQARKTSPKLYGMEVGTFPVLDPIP